MLTAELESLLSRLPKDPTPFPYFKDRYAFLLLEWAAGPGRSIQELKGGPLEPLLRKEAVRNRMAQAAGGVIDAPLMAKVPMDHHEYQLTWGSYDADGGDWTQAQLSRPDSNLVLHVNLPKEHDEYFEGMLAGGGHFPFVDVDHPVNFKMCTLAWARLDWDENDRTLLIEEIQNDWVKETTSLNETLCSLESDEERQAWLISQANDEVRFSASAFSHYFEWILKPHAEMWAEATLAAVLAAARDQLKARAVLIHTYSGGCRMKGIDIDEGPPRELYGRLPKRFGFRRTKTPPPFIARSEDATVQQRLSENEVEWQILELE